MHPALDRELARLQEQEVRRALSRPQISAPRFREALGRRLVRQGFRLMRGWDR